LPGTSDSDSESHFAPAAVCTSIYPFDTLLGIAVFAPISPTAGVRYVWTLSVSATTCLCHSCPACSRTRRSYQNSTLSLAVAILTGPDLFSLPINPLHLIPISLTNVERAFHKVKRPSFSLPRDMHIPMHHRFCDIEYLGPWVARGPDRTLSSLSKSL
jgi:hypothetical protein